MSAAIRTATPADLDRLLALLDEEFVFSRGRTLSFRKRFPTVYSPENAGNIMLAEENGAIVSALATKHFEWIDQGASFRGAMLGAVCTHPLHRGKGWASRVLAFARERLQQKGVDFGVLWTTAPAIYGRSGWATRDCGVLGEAKDVTHADREPNAVEASTIDSAEIQLIESIRRKHLTSRTVRNIGDFRHLPPPAEKVELLFHGQGTEQAGYALAGQNGDTGILYEMTGHSDSFHSLWKALCGRHRHILVNDHRDSASHRWLSHNTPVAWHDKPLAMWLPLSGQADLARISAWYIPYFDRI